MMKKKNKRQWVVTEEKDAIHVRPMINGKILDTPVEKRISYKKD